jgi:hypothetical protein
MFIFLQFLLLILLSIISVHWYLSKKKKVRFNRKAVQVAIATCLVVSGILVGMLSTSMITDSASAISSKEKQKDEDAEQIRNLKLELTKAKKESDPKIKDSQAQLAVMNQRLQSVIFEDHGLANGTGKSNNPPMQRWKWSNLIKSIEYQKNGKLKVQVTESFNDLRDNENDREMFVKSMFGTVYAEMSISNYFGTLPNMSGYTASYWIGNTKIADSVGQKGILDWNSKANI